MRRRMIIIILSFLALLALLVLAVIVFRVSSVQTTTATPENSDTSNQNSSASTQIPTLQPTILQTSAPTPYYNRDCNVYRFKKRSVAVSSVYITKVSITDNETIIDFQFTNSRDANTSIEVDPVGSNTAFFIRSSDGTKSFKLTKVTGIIPGTLVRVVSGQTRNFTLTFQKIDSSIHTFDVIEGGERTDGLTRWDFIGVSLPNRINFRNASNTTPVAEDCEN